jgi:serine/threonine protein kinase
MLDHLFDHSKKHAPRMCIVEVRASQNSAGQPVTYVLATADSKLYLARKDGIIRSPNLSKTDPSTWYGKVGCTPPHRIDPAKLYPEAMPKYHRFRWRKGEDHKAVYKKHRNPVEVAADHGRAELVLDDWVGELTAREISTAEFFRNKPHSNIAKYRGVLCTNELEFGSGSNIFRIKLDTERVHKLVFKRYDSDLQQLVKSRKNFDVRHCLQSIEAGIVHMHSLGLSHNDIKPENIFVECNGSKESSHRHEFVLGDFDSVAPFGWPIELKGGDTRWAKHKSSADAIEELDDYFCLQNIKIWLVSKVGGRLADYDDIGKLVAGANGPRF